MFTLTSIFGILSVHYLADFVCQNKWMAENKSKNSFALVVHTTVYTAVWFVIFALPHFRHLPAKDALAFLVITWGMHTITDGVTAAINADLWEKGKTREFFNTIGLDQLIHYVQLFLCWKIYILS